MNRLAGEVALVTGGGAGIGRAVSERLAAEGARVVVAGRRDAPLAEAVSAIADEGGIALAVAGDVTVEADAVRMVAAAEESFGRLTVLVNNAGIIRRDLTAVETTPADWDQVVDVNLKGAWLVARAALPRLSDGGGVIVNIASTMALVAGPGTAAYQAAKAGLLGLTRSMALDYAPEVRVNAVCPGLVHTAMSYADRPDFDEHVAAFTKLHPLGRLGHPEDIAGAVAFLASPDAAWMTGTTIVVDGGYTLS